MGLNVGRAFAMIVGDKKWFEKILIGVVIWVVASLVQQIPTVGNVANLLVLALTAGYGLRVMRQETTATGESLPKSLPEWDNWAELFKDGVLLTFLQMLYGLAFGAVALVATLMMGVTVELTQVLSSPQTTNIPAEVALVWLVLIVLGIVGAVVYIPLMTAHFAHERRFLAGFEVGTIFRRLFSSIGNVILVVLLSLLLAAALVVSAIIPLVLPFTAFAVQVVLSNLWAQAYRLADFEKTVNV
ncbi:MAG: DUF4013 domain-containing protein [Candidatus Melainabacteria bacterium]|nr:DUF4013 domain-containing protein [Candidatus Melainabacteria bacterium]